MSGCEIGHHHRTSEQRRSKGAHPEKVVKVICGREEIRDIFESSFNGEQKTLERA
jgi:hypothetical protein